MSTIINGRNRKFRGEQVSEVTSYRYQAEAMLLENAINGDEAAIQNVISYLGSSNPDLRGMMQATLHDCCDNRVWLQLLDCVAKECWMPQGADQRAPITNRLQESHQQTIAEAFVIDESSEECQIKESILDEALLEPEANTRYAAAYIKGLRGDEKVIELLAEMVASGKIVLQLRAVAALVVIHNEACGPPLIDALTRYRQEESGQELHTAARHGLSDLGRMAEPALLKALDHPDSHIRWHAARGLGQIGDASGIDVLAEGLHDENQAVRWATASVLAGLDATAVPAILKTLTENELNEPFRQAAVHAMSAMPSSQTRAYLAPVLDALRGPAAQIEAPITANRLLGDWKEAQPGLRLE